MVLTGRWFFIAAFHFGDISRTLTSSASRRGCALSMILIFVISPVSRMSKVAIAFPWIIFFLASSGYFIFRNTHLVNSLEVVRSVLSMSSEGPNVAGLTSRSNEETDLSVLLVLNI